MSSGGQILGAVVGGVAGFFLGGPLGALQGAALGAGIGAALDPPKGPTVEGPRLSDLSIQTSTYGSFMPRFYGTAPAHGNVFWLEGGKLKEVVRKEKSGGKGGGGGATTKTYTYYATFAIGLGEGPIAGIRRIWCRDKLIYNAGSGNLETIIASNKAAKGWRLYRGTDSQMPDPRIEAEKGVGNTPAYRGTAYIVFYDFELTNYNNSVEGAQFKFEVMGYSDFAVSLISTFNATPVQYTDNPSFRPACVYVGAEDSTFAVPRSGFPTTALDLYNSYAASFLPPSVLSMVGSGNPPRYVSDVPGDAIADEAAIFSGVPETAKQSGYFYRKNGTYTGLIDNGANKGLYYRSAIDSFGYSQLLIGAEFVAACSDGNGNIYAFSPTTVNKYTATDTAITLSQTFSVAVPLGPGISVNAAIHNDGAIYLMVMRDAQDNFYRFDETSGYSVVAQLPSHGLSALDGANFSVDGIILSVGFYSTNGRINVYKYNLAKPNAAGVPLSSVISKEVGLSNMLTPSDINVSSISSTVRGYRIQGGTLRASLENLQSVFPFDVRQQGYKLQCIPRGGASIVTIPHDQLGANSGSSPTEILRQSREMDSQLPASTHLKFWDANREYASGEEYADRPGTDSVNRVDREVPIVLTATEAARVADVLQQLPWLERTVFDLDLPPTYSALEPGDVVTVTTPGSIYSLRLTEINDASTLVRKCKAKPANAAIYSSPAVGGEGETPPQTIGLDGPSLFIPLDIPIVDEVSQTSVGFVGAMTGYSEGWPGGLVVRSADGGQTFDDIQAFTAKSTVGVARNALSAHAGYLISSATLTLAIISGEFESITQDQLLTGFNYAAYGVDGRWEIVRFRDATLNADGTYTLSGFVRGDKGTEWATGLHQVGDYFVLLDDPDNAFIGMSIQSIGLDRIYRGVTAGSSVDTASDVSFSYEGVNLEPLSVVNVSGGRDGSQNFTGSFDRRSRLSSTWWTNGVQAPVGETSEAYEIEVMNGSTVVRTISSSTTSFSYTSAQQTTDFGSAQASITFRIYQLSETVGRGYVREVTL